MRRVGRENTLNLPILQAVSQIEIETVVEAAISKKLLQGQERMIRDHFFPFRKRPLLDGELRTSLVI